VSVIVFGLVQLVPGDPIRLALGTRFDQETYDALLARSGLDQPLVTQYFGWAGRALTGDLGVSFRSGETVTSLIAERLPATLTLAFASILVALLIAVPLGTLSALRPRSVVDRVATVLSQIGISVPEFWMAIVLILVFAGTLGWLPSGGYVPLTEDPAGWAQRLLLPAVVTGVVSGSVITRFVRSSVLEALGADHVRTAQAKGLPGRVVVGKHALKNALIPVVTVIGLQVGGLLGNTIITESLFALPGVGRLMVDAIFSRDFFVVQGVILFLTVGYVTSNLVVDVLYSFLDPRIRLR
jgi:peptide/nickel transport system permease protein